MASSHFADEYHVTYKETKHKKKDSSFEANAQLANRIDAMRMSRNLSKDQELKFINTLEILFWLVCLLSASFVAYIVYIWDKGDELYFLAAAGLGCLLVGGLGVYGCRLIKLDIEMRHSAVSVDNSDVLLFTFICIILCYSWNLNVGCELAWNTSHIEEGITGGIYICFATVAVISVMFYHIYQLSLHFEFLHMIIQAVALAQSHLSAYLAGVCLYLIGFEQKSGIEEYNVVLYAILVLSVLGIAHSFAGQQAGHHESMPIIRGYQIACVFFLVAWLVAIYFALFQVADTDHFTSNCPESLKPMPVDLLKSLKCEKQTPGCIEVNSCLNTSCCEIAENEYIEDVMIITILGAIQAIYCIGGFFTAEVLHRKVEKFDRSFVNRLDAIIIYSMILGMAGFGFCAFNNFRVSFD